MSKHTPGPWGYCYDGSGTWSIGLNSDPQAEPPYASIMDRNDERAGANAPLIAAAPDLFKALKAILEEANGDIFSEISYLLVDAGKAAILKAEGT
jgi:hypothetical protein